MVAMKRIAAVAGASMMALACDSAWALSQRTFVASDGNDANPCSRIAPCRAFSAAMVQTSSGGEVVVLDSAGYGPVTINKSVSIIAPEGVHAGITVTSGAGVTVGGSALRVVLRGLSIGGQGGSTGIAVSAINSEVHVERPVISGLVGTAISVNAAGSRVYVEDAQLRSNGASGILVTGGAKAYVDRARIEENANVGVWAYNGSELYLRNSIVHRNGTGVDAIVFSAAAGNVRLVVESTLISGSTFGGINIQVQGGQSDRIDVVVAGSTIVDNAGAGYDGINFQCFDPAQGTLTLVDTTISDHRTSNAEGLRVSGSSCIASVGRNTFTRNGTGMSGTATTLTTFGNNQLDQNDSGDIFGAVTTKATQ
jgi:hypothetical protein